MYLQMFKQSQKEKQASKKGIYVGPCVDSPLKQ